MTDKLKGAPRSFRRRFGARGSLFVAAICATIAVAGAANLAFGSPQAQSSKANPAAQALKLAKQAKALASQALSKAGQPGPAGPAGPTGPQGPPGANGADGTNGTNGADGVSVTSASEPAGTNCADGGSKFTSASGDTYACNGADGADGAPGDPWTAGGTLPPGETEVGLWAFGTLQDTALDGQNSDVWRVPIAFPIPMPVALAPEATHVIDPSGQEIVVDPVSGLPAPDPTPSGACTGSAGNPTADPGHVCVYEQFLTGVATFFGGSTEVPASSIQDHDAFSGTSKPGAILLFKNITAPARGYGGWAVTAPTP